MRVVISGAYSVIESGYSVICVKINLTMEIILSKRGQPMFMINGFLYEKEKEITVNESETRIYSRCCKGKDCGCKARVILVRNSDVYHIKKPANDSDHNHQPMTTKIREMTVKNAMRKMVKGDVCRSVKQCYNEVLSQSCNEMNDETITATPTFDNMSTILYRERSKLRPPLPQHRIQLVLEGEFAKLDSENFILFNTSGEDKMVGFGTEKFLKILCSNTSAKTIYMDGTFKVVPDIFYQLYTIHAFYKKQMFPFVYVLLPNKTEDTYVKMLEEIKIVANNLGCDFEPDIIMTDFELASMNACRRVFPNVAIKGCLFHYNQALWRQFAEKGLVAFKQDPMVMKLFRLCAACSMVKIEDLDEAWLLIAAESPPASHPAYSQCEEFKDYYVSTWLEGKIFKLYFLP